MKGSYILLIELVTNKDIFVGKLGNVFFPKATYAYVGSAMNGLRARLARHLRRKKKLYWHIDYLLKEAEVKEIILCQGDERIECSLAQALAGELQSISGFGSSDCKCRSHLYFTKEKGKLKARVAEAVKQAGLVYEIFPKGVENMAEKFDDSFKELERLVIEDMKRVYSEKTIDHFLNPRNLGGIPAPDGFARITGACGDTMEICLKVRDGKVMNASFWTDGCGCSIASGSMVTELAKGKSVLEAQKITQQDVLDALEGLPEDDLHCALLAANTLKEAIKDYLACQNEPWKRTYRGC